MATKHGTIVGYATSKCRCRKCRAAWATYIRERRQRGDGASRVERELEQMNRELERLVEVDGDESKLPVKISPLALQILVHLQQQTGESRHVILDRLLREYGQQLVAAS